MNNNNAVQRRRSRFSQVLVAGLLSLGLAQGAQADWYFGANTGPMMIDLPGYDDPTNAGLLLGHEWGVVLGDIGLQGEFTTSIDDGAVGGQDVSVSTQALYGVFRSAGPFYLIGKVGMLREEVEIGGHSETDTGASVGAGLGISLGIARIELEYTQIESDIAYVSLGLRI